MFENDETIDGIIALRKHGERVSADEGPQWRWDEREGMILTVRMWASNRRVRTGPYWDFEELEVEFVAGESFVGDDSSDKISLVRYSSIFDRATNHLGFLLCF